MEKSLTAAQRRTLPARLALARKFSSPEEKSQHFRELARRSHERRLTLTGDEVAALAEVSDFLRRLVERQAREEAAHATA